MRTISEKTLNELEEHLEFFGADTVFLMKLERLTGITAHPYTAYSLYDEYDNYLCNSENIDLTTMLRDAGISIRRENLND